jgi:uncharacterized protein (DUF305 family)
MNTRHPVRAMGATLLLATFAGVTAPSAAAARQTLAPSAISAPFDRQFIDMMVPHHQGAVAMAQIALKRGQHQQIRTLARSIIASQNREIGRMKAWRKAWYSSARTPSMEHMPMLPGMSMGTSMIDMMSDIKRLRRAQPFDKAFINAMIPHHQMAVVAARLELQRGSQGPLKALARSIITDQQREIREMKSWRSAWYGSTGMVDMGH